MSIVIPLVERDGTRDLCRQTVVLADQLRLGPAIRLARQLARDAHQRHGHEVVVLLGGLQEAIVLARCGSEPAVA